MLAFTADGQVDEAQLRERDESVDASNPSPALLLSSVCLALRVAVIADARSLGVSTAAKRQLRQGYLRQEDLDRPPAQGCDVWTRGTKLCLELQETK